MVNEFYRRKLPHWQPEGASIFLTWRLFGSLPAHLRTASQNDQQDKTKDSPGKRFKLLDAALDKAQLGPHWLDDPRVALCIAASIHKGSALLGFYTLHAFVVMPNHVHMLVTPKVSLARMTNGLKGVSAREANRILARQGEPFWQDESFDHWVRDPPQFDHIRTYIESNPVTAGLARHPQDWPWSSASQSVNSPHPDNFSPPHPTSS
jgi:hypothetical protein